MHISYFVNWSFKSLIKLPGLNARGVTSPRLPIVPWGDQYRVVSKNEYWICTYEYEDQEYYEDEEDYAIEYLSHQGWVQV